MSSLIAWALTWPTPVVTWVLIGKQDTGPDHDFRPFYFNFALEKTVGSIAALSFVSALVLVLVGHGRPLPGKGINVRAVCYVVVGAVGCSVAWRYATAGVYGANIGGDGLLLFAPLLLGGMLITATVIQQRYRQRTQRRTAAVIAAIVLLCLLPYVLI